MPFSKLSSSAKWCLIFSPTVVFVLQNSLQITTVTGFSMTPTFNEIPGSTTKLLIERSGMFKLDPKNRLRVNDVIQMRSPVDPERLLIKRIKGLEGDVITPRDQDYPAKIVRVPVNHVWVEGDNSFHSIDSNTFGPVSVGLIEAIVWKRVDPSRFPYLFDLREGGREARLSLINRIDQY
ncbi:endopeptidase catalytic subunit [Saccharomycopsis crataegensis]|uniref:Mitochondrial inner membrane protease subunit 2 n=1 Tax=Saccharomycopsis crataegensis TaxID=43959 RepID=A0AAV5QN64_9ASCO|nr:endopeptidase catalytic subunit [Saccharomycopsis crataegensis]